MHSNFTFIGNLFILWKKVDISSNIAPVVDAMVENSYFLHFRYKFCISCIGQELFELLHNHESLWRFSAMKIIVMMIMMQILVHFDTF